MKKLESKFNLSPITLGEITRLLRTVRGLKSHVYVVGGLVTEGQTLRDIDIVVRDLKDISKIKGALGQYAKRAHFILRQASPPAPMYVKITGEKPGTEGITRVSKGKKIPPNEYAGSK